MEYKNVSAKLAIPSVQRMNAFDDRRETRYVLMLDNLLDIARTCRPSCPREWDRESSSCGGGGHWLRVEDEIGSKS